VTSVVRDALTDEPGSVLVFLPGMAEIRRVAERLGDPGNDVDVRPLHGSLPPADQDAAIAPAAEGRRKVVLATSIAETSLTIEGVRVVVDAGLERRARFDPGSGMTRLLTTRVSRAAADQRAGRAGRLEPGVCYRLWSEAEHKRLPAFTPPEILEADLAPLVLELAHWGTRDPGALDWLDPPPAAHWAQAADLLHWLDAVDANGAITPLGREMLATGLHPRLARMVVLGRRAGFGATAGRLAALLGERDVLAPDAGADLVDRLDALDGKPPAGVRRGALHTVRKLAGRLSGRDVDRGTADPGALLAQAFPDRVAKRRPGGPARFRLANGRGAWLPDDDPLAGCEWLVAAELDDRAREARIFLAARIDERDVEQALGERIVEEAVTEWDERRGTVVVRHRRRLGALILSERDAGAPTPEQRAAGLVDAVRRKGLDALHWSDAARALQARIEFLRRLDPDAWPAFDEASLDADLDEWLAPFMAGMTHWREVRAMDLMPALMHRLGPDRVDELDRLAPARLDVPAGRAVRIDYAAEGGPVLAVKLQAVFGWMETPRVADGRVPVVLHLLDPAGRPLAVTSDLASFWANAYPDVARDMRGRYPKHPWPDDPLAAEATMRTKRRT
jgi:ATP-dependent helicase HrpB